MQSWYSIRAAAGGDGEIHVYDEIGGWGISARQFVEDLQALGAVKTLTVRINSPGGSFFDGVAIYNALTRHPARRKSGEQCRPPTVSPSYLWEKESAAVDPDTDKIWQSLPFAIV
ncbi:MAG: ATP-dependent Clp protease proteolytic subunit [Rhodospirillales bacterium]|nr:ATP-dependent Clp protease proteolytic subunit [Rhodospirillales bacterium]